MDQIGGINPSNPRLDNQAPAQPNQFANTDISGMQPSSPITPPILETPIAPTPVQLPGNDQFSEPIIAQAAPGGSSGKAKKIILIILAVLVLGGLVGGAYFLGLTAGKTKGRTEADAEYQRRQAAQQQEDSEPEESTDETTDDAANLQLGDLADPKYVDETVDGEVGKQLAASDGLVLKVTNIERNFKSTDANYKLDATKELVKVNFLVGNVTKGKTKDISSFNFRLENSANAQLTPENIASYADKFDTLKLEPGAQAKGSIVYAVNKDEKPLKFVREQRYRISGENREVTTRIVVSVVK